MVVDARRGVIHLEGFDSRARPWPTISNFFWGPLGYPSGLLPPSLIYKLIYYFLILFVNTRIFILFTNLLYGSDSPCCHYSVAYQGSIYPISNLRLSMTQLRDCS
jgi:hypothetical protein